jgi:hypothetical protein
LFSDRTTNGSWKIFVANVDGGSVQQLTDDAGSNCYASWSPDERYIAYLHFEKPMNQSPGPARLMLFDTETATRAAWPGRSEVQRFVSGLEAEVAVCYPALSRLKSFGHVDLLSTGPSN